MTPQAAPRRAAWALREWGKAFLEGGILFGGIEAAQLPLMPR